MRKRGFWVLAIALVFAVAAVFMAKNWLNKKSIEALNNNAPMATVVVARTTLDFGAIIKNENLKVIPWPAKNLPANSFRNLDELVKKDSSRVVIRRIEANEPILASKVSGFGGRASLSTIIENDMRATTIRVNDVNGVAGFVLPGDRVDILITRLSANGQNAARQSRTENLITDLLLQNVKVLAIDQDASENKEKPSVAKAVTLEITPLQAQKLVLAQQVGTLSLALRNMKNGVAAVTRTVSISDLRVGEINDRAPVQKPVKVGTKPAGTAKRVVKTGSNGLSSVKVYRGTKASQYRVPKERGGNVLPTNLVPKRTTGDRIETERHVEVPEVAKEKAQVPTALVPMAPVSVLPSTAPNLAAR